MDQHATWYGGKTSAQATLCLGPKIGKNGGFAPLKFGSQLPVKGAQPQFSLHIYCGHDGWMDEDDTWYGSRPRPRPHCV